MKRHPKRSLAGMILGLAIASPGKTAEIKAPPPPAPPQPAQIDRNGVLMLVRSTLLALDQANETGNYTVLRDLGAPAFQQANNAARLTDIFANQRNQKLDLSGVAVIEPQLSLLPQIENGGLLHMAGFFPSAPMQINFDLSFAPVDGRWRLFGVTVNVGSSAPAAPAPPIQAQPAPKPIEAKAGPSGGRRDGPDKSSGAK